MASNLVRPLLPGLRGPIKDGRILVVEYKGADRWAGDDSREKRKVGELWAERSNSRCLFVMPKGKDWLAIQASIRMAIERASSSPSQELTSL